MGSKRGKIKVIKTKKLSLGLNWVFSKLREWVGTVTGKGDRWGRGSR